jgi:hypothetical protein
MRIPAMCEVYICTLRDSEAENHFGQQIWQGKKDSNLRMLESKSSALTNLATPLHGLTANRCRPINLRCLPNPLRGVHPNCYKA